MTQFKSILIGHDTIECAYYLRTQGGSGLDFARLSALKEGMRNSKYAEAIPLKIGGEEFLFQPYGTKSGYPFVLKNHDYSIQCGEFNNPSFFVTYRSEGLWQYGALALQQKFLAWANGLGLYPFKAESLSRVDFTFDYWLPVIDFDEECVVSLSAKDNKHRKNGRIQTITYGSGGDVVLRIYNKVAEIEEKSLSKTWFFDLWGIAENVWRIEWQTRKDILRRFSIRTLDDLLAGQGDILRYLAHEHDTLRIKTDDSNRSRWPLHPLWQDLHQQIAKLEYQGVYREIDQTAVLSQRQMRIAVSVYGNLKRVAAIHGLQHGDDAVSLREALERIEQLISRVHDPMTWQPDVQKRMTQMRLGQW